ncbi:MAG: endolytic transglycosylase MltG [Clostridia bacterium]|nr:endolytic transglycosylase MltG [Clostridia bacterium]
MDNNRDPSKEKRNIRIGNTASVHSGDEASKARVTERGDSGVSRLKTSTGDRPMQNSNPMTRNRYFTRPDDDDMKLGVERSKVGENRVTSERPRTETPSPRVQNQTAPSGGSVRTSPALAPSPSQNPDGRPVVGQRGASTVPTPEIPDEALRTKQVPIVETAPKKDEDETLSAEDTIELPGEVMENTNSATQLAETTRKGRKAGRKIRKKRGDKERSESGNTVLSLVKCMAYITAVFAVSIVISVAVIFAANDMYGFVKSDEQIEVVIPKGTTIEDVADILYNNKLIKYKWLFNLKEGDSTATIQPGTYMLTPKSSYSDFVEAISKKPPAGVSWITIPEGYTTDEIIDLLVSSGIGERDKYIDVINNYDFDYWFIDEIDEDWVAYGRTYRLDGYLFPDTYQFYNASSEVAVISKLLSRFNQVFIKSYRQRTEEIGFVTDEVITLSSIIEKEAGAANYLENCFGNVSSVFHNRLESANYSHLQSDATTAYVIHHETGVRVKLRGSDLDNIVSEYNTETRLDLTPGAIANSGNSAILAAMHPSDTDYYYFFSPSNPKPGEDRVIFSRTVEEHNAVVSRYS